MPKCCWDVVRMGGETYRWLAAGQEVTFVCLPDLQKSSPAEGWSLRGWRGWDPAEFVLFRGESTGVVDAHGAEEFRYTGPPIDPRTWLPVTPWPP